MLRLAHHSARHLLSRVVVLSALVAIIPGCSGIGDSGRRDATATNGLSQTVFSEGYSLIADRYIDPVAVNQLAMDGLTALSDADSELAIDSTGGKVQVRANGVYLREFQSPGRNDADSWGQLTVNVIASSQDASPTLKAMSKEKIYEAVFDGALTKLDRYSRYASPDEARDHRADREGFGGIGMHLSVIDGVTRIVAVMPETPAERAGLKDNDVIVAIDGDPIAGWELRDVVRRLRGPVGSTAKFSVTRHGMPEPLKFSVRRERIIPTSVIYRREGNAAYVRITRFNQGTARSFRERVVQAREDIGPEMTGVIVDLRDNPGGLLDQAVAVTDSLLKGGRIVSTRGRHRGSFQQYDASDNDVAEGLPMVLLINGGSASASEIMAAALQDDGRAIVLGSNSYGKGVVQSVYRLPNDGELTLTWSRFHAPSGYNLQDLGVMPTVCTNELKADQVAELLRTLREGRIGTKATLANWRREALPDEETRTRLRANCPASRRVAGEDDHDMTLAKAILEDKALYSIALRESSLPELARSE